MHTEGTRFLQMHSILVRRNCKNWRTELNTVLGNKGYKWTIQQPNMYQRDKGSTCYQKVKNCMFLRGIMMM